MRPFKKLPGALFRALGYYPTRLRGAPLRVDPNHWRFWRKAARGLWEPDTLALLEQQLSPQMTVCDIGAWIGPTVLCAAQRCRHVYCFEPDTAAYAELLRNLQLNAARNVTPFNLALTARDGTRRLASFGGEPGDSRSSLLATAEAGAATEVIGLSWTRWLEIAQPPRIDFLKIDIEGGEFELLPAMSDYLASQRPPLLLSTHAPYLESAARAAAMRRLADALRGYRRCTTPQGEAVGVEALLAPDACQHFRTFFLTD
ncbi:MAG TPA: FkbM family methyltransferase [Burkholderiales bacterium]|nr:FkbM family methyltransferase [Burkholderiales bacterium]